MTFNVYRQTLVAILLTILSAILFFVGIVTRFEAAKEPACHDAVYVFPLSPTEDEDPRVDLPGKKMQFVCPHSLHKLAVIGRGGFTCTCDQYRAP